MTKTISETHGKIGDKKTKKEGNKKQLDNSIKIALLSAAVLMKDIMGSSDSKRIHFCLDLKNKLEEVEKEYRINLI